jgi:septal ring factor EnvC (AmiA/AmiB activator)
VDCPIFKQLKEKHLGWESDSSVEYLSSKNKITSSNPSSRKRREEKRKREGERQREREKEREREREKYMIPEGDFRNLLQCYDQYCF